MPLSLPRRTAAQIALRVRRAGGDVFTARRLILALKTAVAAAVAWFFAPLVPFADADYSYYAPLGVLVSMYPTVADSARAGIQSLIGLACGIAVGFGGLAIVASGAPGIVAVGVVVLAGVAVGGIRALGMGRDWVALAGLFVLLLSKNDPDGFSSSYLATMAFGVLVGVVANYVLVPPLYLQSARDRLSELRAAVVTALDRAADAVAKGEPDRGALVEDGEALAELSIAVSADVDEASRSERANIRARGVGGVHDENAHRWWGLERATYLARDMLDVLGQQDCLDERHGDPELLAAAMRSVAEQLATPPGDPETTARTDAAWRAIDEYAASLPAADEAADEHDQPGLWLAATLGRMTDVSRRVSAALV
ncbi:FUSC family protein [Microbacterium oleivorans]|uniref:FUSC family protein n=1 Tax=Microbacterium oleivorans TaxID=273677 RepID=UPI0020409E90|nr:FUSC family protein [Microbacterium oleivorans]MCM3697477.1 FUSC family protein [Microbacterium oleivorans]